MKEELKSVYIHIPFCKTICSYCDFCKVFYNDNWVEKYLDCLKIEIEDNYNNEPLESIYIGGGTPSALSKKHLNDLFEIVNLLNRESVIEFTFECNLNDITKELLEILHENKVNRLSIGIQSFNPEKLKYMGRNHTWEEAEEKIKLCRNEGFHNINIDFIYGFSFEEEKMLKKDLKQILSLKPEHISTYSLMVEKGTLLTINRFDKRANDELDAQMYEMICDTLELKKYNHYEISNFALKGKESIHNLRYWKNLEYYGFGLSASGYIDKIRYTNTKSLTKYFKFEFDGEKDLLSKQDIMDNHMMLGLRLTKGINKSEFENIYKIKMEEAYPINPLLKNKDLIEKKGNIFINPDKLYIMNEILLKMI